jgi:hypothetical protein
VKKEKALEIQGLSYSGGERGKVRHSVKIRIKSTG